MAAPKKERADLRMVAQGLAQSRSQAQGLILAGQVVDAVTQQRIEKPGTLIAETIRLGVTGDRLPFVSRGGLKLSAALATFAVDVKGVNALDIGASTGGFTDCLLQMGAAHVTAVDVGYNQLAFSLRQDARVTCRERVNMREPPANLLVAPVDIIVIDVSFISLTLIIPPTEPLLRPEGVLIALVKPQFEAGFGEVGKGGIVRETKVRERALARVVQCAEALSFGSIQTMPSPILGAKGNHEFLLFARRSR